MNNKDFINLYISHFGKDVDQQFLNAYVYDQYAWHIFSFQKIDHSKYSDRNKAVEEYLKIDKKNAIALKRFPDELIIDSTKFDTVEKLKQYTEIYIFDKDFNWCFFLTHECDLDRMDDINNLGPYFIKKRKRVIKNLLSFFETHKLLLF